jgi:hypothetical protein
MLTNFKKRSALLLTLAVACATVAIVPQTATAAGSKFANAGAATTPYTAPGDIGAMTACPGTTAPAAGFSDTTSTDVDCIKMFGITQGTTATTFEPDGTIPRWQMALFIHRMFVPTGVAAAGLTAVPAFTDISGLSTEIQAAVNALASHGITTGTTATTFDPSSNVTREQMALFLNRFATIAKSVNGSGALITMPSTIGSAGAGNGAVNYSDISNTSLEGWEAITRLFNLGVTEGLCVGGVAGVSTCGSTYRPAADITRGEMASMVKRLLDKSNARPAGISIQTVEGIATAGAKTTIISMRNADFSAQANTLVDEFYDATELTTARALAANAPFNALGVCNSSNVATTQGTKCSIDTADLATTVSGNVAGQGLTTAASSSTTWYVWTGTTGTAYNSSAPGYIMDVVMGAAATAPVNADTTTYTISGANTLGKALALDYNGYDDDIHTNANDGVSTFAGGSRTITATMTKAAAATSTVVDGYTFKFAHKTVSMDGTVTIANTYVPSSGGTASYTVTCGADDDATDTGQAGNAGGSYWQSHHVTVTMGTAAGGTGIPANANPANPLASTNFPTIGGGNNTLNISCDDHTRAYTAGTTADTLDVSQNYAVASATGTLIGITTTAYDQYGAGIAGITSKIGVSTDGGGVNNQAVLTSNAAGKATLNMVVCLSAGNANGTEAFSQVNGGGSTMNAIAATAPHAGGSALVPGTTVHCATAFTNASTVGGDGYSAVTDVQEVQKVLYSTNTAPTVAVDASAGEIKCHIGVPANLSAAIAHDEHTANNIRDDLNAITGLSGAVVTMFAGAATVYGVTHPASDAANAGFYVQFPANTGNWPQLVCTDLLSGADNFVTAGGAAEPIPSTLVQGVAGQTWKLVDADTAANTMVVKHVTKTTNAAGASADTVLYKSFTWDSDDIFMGATPGMTEAAFETALAAVTNTSTNVSGMLRTVATGTGLSVFQLG